MPDNCHGIIEQDYVDLLINTRSLTQLESYALRRPISLATPYQLKAYCGPKYLMKEVHPLIDLCIDSDIILTRVVEDRAWRSYCGAFPIEALVPVTTPLDKMATFFTRAAKLTRVTASEDLPRDIRRYLETVNCNASTPLAQLETLDYLSSKTYPRESEAILPDLGDRLFKNRLRSFEDYRVFLEQLDTIPDTDEVVGKLKDWYSRDTPR